MEETLNLFKKCRKCNCDRNRNMRQVIYNICEKYPNDILNILTRDDFSNAKMYWQCVETEFTPGWELHLQQIILEKDHLEYMSWFI